MVYITHRFFEKWNIDTTATQAGDETTESGKVLTPPRLWYDFTGTLVPNALRACREAVLGLLVSRPGISFVGFTAEVFVILLGV